MMDEFVTKGRLRRERRRRLKWYVLSFLLLTLIAGAFYGFKTASFLQITTLTVQAPEGETKEEFLATIQSLALAGAVSAFLGPTHYFAWPNEIAYSDATTERVEIRKNLFARTVAVEAMPRVPFGVWCFLDGACFWVDASDGVLMRRAPEPDGTVVIKISDRRDLPVNTSAPVLPRQLFENLKAIVAGVRLVRLAVAAAVVDHVLQEVHFTTFAGAEIRFDLRKPPNAETFASLRAVLAEIDLTKTEYVDLTVEKKVYVKNR